MLVLVRYREFRDQLPQRKPQPRSHPAAKGAVSRNQRAVDEATSWLKRVVVTWIILNTLGFIVAYLQPLIAGGQYTG